MKIWCDGGVSPNPGKGKVKIVAEVNGRTEYEKEWPFEGTNNEAEMHALIKALIYAKNYNEHYDEEVQILTDSQNVICWMDGRYKVKATNIRELYRTAYMILDNLQNKYRAISLVKTTHAENKAHPELSNIVAAPLDELVNGEPEWSKQMALRHTTQIHIFNGKNYVLYDAWDKAIKEIHSLLKEIHDNGA